METDLKKTIFSLMVIFWFALVSGSSLWFCLDKVSLKKNQDLAKQVEAAFQAATQKQAMDIMALNKKIEALSENKK